MTVSGLEVIRSGHFKACNPLWIQYIPRNMHTVFALLCFVVVIHWLIFPYPSGLLHWHCGNLGHFGKGEMSERVFLGKSCCSLRMSSTASVMSEGSWRVKWKCKRTFHVTDLTYGGLHYSYENILQLNFTCVTLFCLFIWKSVKTPLP